MTKSIVCTEHAWLSEAEKLQVFVELACYCYKFDRTVMDPSDCDNRDKAGKWLDELSFLADEEMNALVRVWDIVIEDGTRTRELFTVVKSLQEKYS